MLIRCVKKDGGLYPFDRESEKYFSKLTSNEYIEVNIARKRNHKFHRKYFAMLRLVSEQLDCSIDTLHDFIKEKLNMYDIVSIGGEIRKSYYSIAFSKMDDAEFACYYDDSLMVLSELLAFNHKELLDEITLMNEPTE